MLTRPRALPKNAHVAVLAASGPSELERIEQGKRNLEARGVRVTLAPNIARKGAHSYLAGEDDARVEADEREELEKVATGLTRLFGEGGSAYCKNCDIKWDASAYKNNKWTLDTIFPIL